MMADKAFPSARTVSTAAGAVVALLCGQAAAQLERPTGSRIGQPAAAQPSYDSHLSPSDLTRQVVNDFGQCVVLKDGKRIEQALDRTYHDAAATVTLQRAATSECLSDADLRMSEDNMRGALFRALYRRDFAKAQPVFLDQPVDFAMYVSDLSSGPNVAFVELRDFADCMVRANLGDSRTMLLAETNSVSEAAAFTRLAPKFGSCLSSGLNLRLNKGNVANLLGEALYRESKAAARGAAPARSN